MTVQCAVTGRIFSRFALPTVSVAASVALGAGESHNLLVYGLCGRGVRERIALCIVATVNLLTALFRQLFLRHRHTTVRGLACNTAS